MSQTNYVNKDVWSGTATSTAGGGTLTPVAGDDLILLLITQGSSTTVTSVASTLGGGVNIIQDVPFSIDPTNKFGFAAYRVHGASATAQNILVTFGSSTSYDCWLVEASSVGAFGNATAVNSGLTANFTTNSLTPPQNGALLLAWGLAGGSYTWSAWGNGFTDLGSSSPGPSRSAGYLAQTTAAPVAAPHTLSGATSWSALLVSYVPVNPAPTVNSVNGGANVVEGSTGIAVVGTNYASGITSAIAQPSVSVAQTTTFNSSTSASFTLIMEPGTGSQLAFTDATYTTSYSVTVGGTTSTSLGITLVPVAGLIFQTLGTINTNSAYIITATPSLTSGDQLEASGNATGSAAVPAGLALNADGTYQFSAGNTPQDFYVRAYDGTGKTWGAWALQTVTSAPVTNPGGWRNFKVYELSSVTGLVRWVHYIPVQFPASVPTTEYDRVDLNGAVTCTVLSSTAGLVQWVDYTPVYVTTDPVAGKWRYDNTGWIPLVRLN